MNVIGRIKDIPPLPGIYALHLRLPVPQTLAIGQLGERLFPAGEYIYIGSAQGPGGLRARLGRHLRGPARRRWHIDYLREMADPAGFWFQVMPRDDENAPECAWVRAARVLPGAEVPFPGFGSSDCRSGCTAHLLWVPLLTNPQPEGWPAEVK